MPNNPLSFIHQNLEILTIESFAWLDFVFESRIQVDGLSMMRSTLTNHKSTSNSKQHAKPLQDPDFVTHDDVEKDHRMVGYIQLKTQRNGIRREGYGQAKRKWEKERISPWIEEEADAEVGRSTDEEEEVRAPLQNRLVHG